MVVELLELDLCKFPRFDEVEPLRPLHKAGVAERRLGVMFQSNQVLGLARATLDAHLGEVGQKVLLGVYEFSREYFSGDFHRIVPLVTVELRIVAVDEMMLQLVGHREDCRVQGQALRHHDRRTAFVVEVRSTKALETRPKVDSQPVGFVYPAEV